MSKYDPLWAAIATHEEPSFILTFDEIRQALGFEIDTRFSIIRRNCCRLAIRLERFR